MDGRVPKERPAAQNGAGPREPYLDTAASVDGVQKAQELGDLYFAADNYAVALEYYRRALDAEAARGDGAERDTLFGLGRQIVDCLRYRGNYDEAVDALHDLHRRLRPHVTREQIGRASCRERV